MPHFVIHLPVIGHLDCFCSLAILNTASENTAEQGSVEEHVQSFGQMPRSGNAGSYGRFVFKFFGNHPAFSRWRTNSDEESPFPTSSPASVVGYFVNLHISLIVRTNGHFLGHLLTIFISSLESSLFKSQAHFWNGHFYITLPIFNSLHIIHLEGFSPVLLVSSSLEWHCFFFNCAEAF